MCTDLNGHTLATCEGLTPEPESTLDDGKSQVGQLEPVCMIRVKSRSSLGLKTCMWKAHADPDMGPFPLRVLQTLRAHANSQ